MDKLNSMAGGGKQSEQKEDTLDKGTPPSSLRPSDPHIVTNSSQASTPSRSMFSVRASRTTRAPSSRLRMIRSLAVSSPPTWIHRINMLTTAQSSADRPVVGSNRAHSFHELK